MRALRNIAIIMLLAFVVAEVPGGGNVSQGTQAALSIAFLVAIAGTGWLLYRQNRLAYMTLPDRDRAILLGSVGAIVLLMSGRGEVLDWGIGPIVFIAVIGLALLGIIRVVMDSRAI